MLHLPGNDSLNLGMRSALNLLHTTALHCTAKHSKSAAHCQTQSAMCATNSSRQKKQLRKQHLLHLTHTYAVQPQLVGNLLPCYMQYRIWTYLATRRNATHNPQTILSNAAMCTVWQASLLCQQLTLTYTSVSTDRQHMIQEVPLARPLGADSVLYCTTVTNTEQRLTPGTTLTSNNRG